MERMEEEKTLEEWQKKWKREDGNVLEENKTRKKSVKVEVSLERNKKS